MKAIRGWAVLATLFCAGGCAGGFPGEPHGAHPALLSLVGLSDRISWRRVDSNHRPSGYEPDELPLLYAAKRFIARLIFERENFERESLTIQAERSSSLIFFHSRDLSLRQMTSSNACIVCFESRDFRIRTEHTIPAQWQARSRSTQANGGLSLT